MRLHIISDLHLEFAPFNMPRIEADIIIFAGDMHTGLNGFKWIQQNVSDCPVIYVLGNHEYYGQTLPKLTNELKKLAKGTNIHVLENNSIKVGGVTFIGATLWTDLELYGDPLLAGTSIQVGMSDFRRIRTLPNYSRLRAMDTRRLHLESREWLVETFSAAKDQCCVVVTHHAPSPKSIPSEFCRNELNPGYASNLEQLIAASAVKLWIHGHIHSRSDYLIGSTRVLANPRGYPEECNNGFDPNLIVEI